MCSFGHSRERNFFSIFFFALPKTVTLRVRSVEMAQTYNPRRLVGIQAERVTDVSSRDFPGHYPDEDHSWNMEKFREVRLPGNRPALVVH
jgi:hypothetical protein